MKKSYLLFLIVITACTSTKITKYTSYPRILAGESILLMDIGNVNETDAFSFYNTTKSMLAESNLVKFLKLEEYDLLARGVEKSDLQETFMADSIMTVVADITDCRYLVFVDITDRYHRDSEVTNEAELFFHIVDTKDKISLSEFKINTIISPLEIPDNNDEPLLLNVTNTSTAVHKAFKKGIKQIRKGVVKK